MTFPNQDVRIIIVLNLFNNMVNDIDILTYNKITDFQIGDFIKFRQEIFLTDQDGVETTQDIVYEIGKICALNNIGNVWVNDCEGQEYQITVDEIEPIPLTPEILERNDFEHEDSVGYVYDDYETKYKVIVDLSFPAINILHNYELASYCAYCGDVNLHDLQHALKHCEIKKEIIL